MAQGRSRNWPVVKICCTVEVLQFLLEHFRSLKIINDSKEFLFMWVMQAGVHVQSCLTLCDCMVCSPPGSSVHWMSQARILEWVALSFSRGLSPLRDRTCISWVLVGRFFTRESPGKPLSISNYQLKTQPRHLRNINQFILSDINNSLLVNINNMFLKV